MGSDHFNSVRIPTTLGFQIQDHLGPLPPTLPLITPGVHVCTLAFLSTIPPPPNKNHKENEKLCLAMLFHPNVRALLLDPLKVTKFFGLFSSWLLFFGPKKEGTCVEFYCPSTTTTTTTPLPSLTTTQGESENVEFLLHLTTHSSPSPLIEKQREKKGEQNWPFPKSKTTIALHMSCN